jgi:hypothetical protein
MFDGWRGWWDYEKVVEKLFRMNKNYHSEKFGVLKDI